MSLPLRVCGSTCEPGSMQCLARKKLEDALRKYFKHTWAIGGTVACYPRHNVFVCIATGAGKSLCMFLAPLAVSKSAVGGVISPLNCLMEQQV